MHIPDGFLSLPVVMVCWFISVIAISLVFKNFEKVDVKKIHMFAFLGALVFLMQMLNFPVLGGTSGHLLGGALLAFLVGFNPAVIIMSTILVVQALVFHDGGVMALGANLLNMAVIAPFIGLQTKKFVSNNYLGLGIASLLSVVIASFVASLQLFFSGSVELFSVLTAMVSVHFLIGLGESLLSLGVFAYVENKLPVLSLTPQKIVTASVLMLLLTPFASGFPDGLEATAEKLEFDSLALDSMTPLTVMADYLFPFIGNEAMSTMLAGLFGSLIVFFVIAGLFKIRK